jgi:hypothetical protein
VADIFDVRRLVLGEQVVDLGDVQVSHVVAVGGDGVLVGGHRRADRRRTCGSCPATGRQCG